MNSLPNIGTPEQCREKMKEGFKKFVDSCAKFVALCEYYQDETKNGKDLDSTFVSKYNYFFGFLKKADSQAFRDTLAAPTALTLDFIDDIKTNVEAYLDALENKEKEDLSDYDKGCDYLAIRDEFTDLQEVIDDANKVICDEKALETNYNDPEYDPNCKAE